MKVFYSLLFTITLSAGFILHGVFSLAAIALWRLCSAWFDQIAARRCARLLFSLRVAPLMATGMALSFLIVPAFLSYEPRTTAESLPLTLLVLAVIAIVILAGALSRSAKAAIHSRLMRRALLGSARAEEINGISVYRCSAPFPVLAVLGIWRPRILVSESVFTELNADELTAALSHEAVHVRSADVLKKAVLQTVPSILPRMDGLKPIAEAWARMCELSADQEAVGEDSGRKLHLASALVKVARLTAASPRMPVISAALLSNADLLLSCRVQQLLKERESDGRAGTQGNHTAFLVSFLFSASVLVLLTLFYSQVLTLTYTALEFLVHG